MVNVQNPLAPWRHRALIAAAPAIVAAMLPTLSTAASVTFTSSNCSSYVLSGTPPNQTVTCVAGGGGGGGGVPVCTPTANPASPAVGESTTISANCTNQPTSYAWTGCAHSAATCTVAKERPGSATYTVKANNASGSGAAASITVTWH